MVNKYKSYFIFILSIIIAIFYYIVFLEKINNKDFNCLLPKANIILLEGTVCGTPIKNKNNSTYKVAFTPKIAYSKQNERSSIVNEKITLVLKKEFIETFYPGSLYSISKNKSSIIDLGSVLVVNGYFFKNTDIFNVLNLEQKEWGNSFCKKIYKIRALIRLELRRILYSFGKAGNLLLALITGIRDNLDEDLTKLFMLSGLTHVLALSGMHLSLFTSFISFFKTNIFSINVKRIFSIFIAFIFIFFAGRTPSLTRAFIFLLINYFIIVSGLEKITQIEVLSITFLIHILLYPKDLNNLGFIFSYSSLLGIFLFSNYFESKFSMYLPTFVSKGICSSLGANIIIFPLMIIYFGIYTPVGIISSFIITPIIFLFMIVGIFFIIICICIPFFVPIGDFFLNLLYSVIEKCVYFFSCFPYIKFTRSFL